MKFISANASSNSSGASSLTDLTLVPSAPSPVGCHPAADESSLTKLGRNVPDIRSAATLKFEEEMKRITDSVGKSETQRPVEAPPEAPPGLSANAGDPCQLFFLTAVPTTIQESQDEVKNPSTPIAGRRRRTRADSWWVRGGPITELFQLHTPLETGKFKLSLTKMTRAPRQTSWRTRTSRKSSAWTTSTRVISLRTS